MNLSLFLTHSLTQLLLLFLLIISFHPSLVLACKHQLHPATPISISPLCTPLPFSGSILALATERVCVESERV